VKDYRAASTRNFLANVVPTVAEDKNSGPQPLKNPLFSSTAGRLPYTSFAQMMPMNSNDLFGKKIDTILTKVEEEFAATRRFIHSFVFSQGQINIDIDLDLFCSYYVIIYPLRNNISIAYFVIRDTIIVLYVSTYTLFYSVATLF